MELALLEPKQPHRLLNRFEDCSLATQHNLLSQWTIEQLKIEPYQHILEIGYSNGFTLHEISKKLKVGFLAGIDASIKSYLQAYKKNKQAIESQLMELHFGEIQALPYPSQYFHSIYSINQYDTWQNPQSQFMQLSSLLKTAGRLISVFQQRSATTENVKWMAAEKIMQEYEEAGFTDLRLSFMEMRLADGIAITGIKP
ncbi:MAG: methyltransferase domain-containing protein [Bacteroidetes bacterium]|nr:methyltransferase domain-containing protein [Bacteroidota bacterium]